MADKAKKLTVKPCPFCSNKSSTIGVRGFGDDHLAVVCGDCGSMGPIVKDAEEALEKWNSRTVVILDEATYKRLQEDSGGKEEEKR